jgi:hypothetical protein
VTFWKRKSKEQPHHLYRAWRQYAEHLIQRGHATDDEIAELNRRAMLYGHCASTCVHLTGIDQMYCPKNVEMAR